LTSCPRLARLPASIASDVEPWLDHLRHGDSRHRPKAPGTWRGYCTAIMPALLAWGQDHATLREITRDDIIEPLAGPRPRRGDNHTLATAVRSLFSSASASPAGGSSPTEATAADTRDPMHLASMFGLHPNTAQRYVDAAYGRHDLSPADRPS
jgi:hypothetical protein